MIIYILPENSGYITISHDLTWLVFTARYLLYHKSALRSTIIFKSYKFVIGFLYFVVLKL